MSLIKSLLLSLLLASSFAFTAQAATPVNINTADAATLAATMNGVGMTKAEAIVAYRKQHGAFRSLDQLADVKGIGLKTIEKNRSVVTVGAPARAPAKSAAKPPAKPAAKPVVNR